MGLFGKGKMEVTLDKYSFEPGENITGNMSFTLKKPVEARGVFTHLIGEERATETYTAGASGEQRTRTVWNEVYNMSSPWTERGSIVAGVPTTSTCISPGMCLGDLNHSDVAVAGKNS